MFTGTPVIPLETHAKAKTPGGVSIELSQRGDEWFLTADRILVRATASTRIQEIAVIEVCQPLAAKRQPRVLIEGLGLGAAARKALQVLPPRGYVTVAEAAPAIIEWQRRFLRPLPVSNPEHFRVLPKSLRLCLETHPNYFDAVVLELDYAVDPFLESASRPAQYRPAVELLKQALRPRGRLAIHGQEKDASLIKALENHGFIVDHRLEAPHKKSKARRHHLTFAQIPPDSD